MLIYKSVIICLQDRVKIRTKQITTCKSSDLNRNNVRDCLQMPYDLPHIFLPSMHCTSVSSVTVHSIAVVAQKINHLNCNNISHVITLFWPCDLTNTMLSLPFGKLIAILIISVQNKNKVIIINLHAQLHASWKLPKSHVSLIRKTNL